jgi:hypothetical protein
LDTIQEDEVLKNMVMELSIDDPEEAKDERAHVSNLEQTIIIGEMDEGNIFDDLTEKDQKQANETVTISKQDLMGLIDNIKTRYIAEMDAIMLEQTSYKRIITQMVQRMKHMQAEHNQLEIERIQF